MTFRNFLREWRLVRGLSVRKLASMSDVSGTYISDLESGKITDPSPRKLWRIAEALRVPYYDLMRAAGYIIPDPDSAAADPRGALAALLNLEHDLTEDERTALLDFFEYIRWRQGTHDPRRAPTQF